MSSSSALRRAQRITLLSGVPLAVAVVAVLLLLAGVVSSAVRPGGLGEVDEASEQPWLGVPALGPQPEGARIATASVDAIEIWYAEYGPDRSHEAAKRPVVLLHGGLADSDYWNYLVPALVAKGRTVIVMDSRGHGRTTSNPEPYSYPLLAEDVQLLLEKFLHVPKADFVGWSDGGIVGIELAIHSPGLVGSLFTYGANTQLDGLDQAGEDTPAWKLGTERAHQEYLKVSPRPQDWDELNEKVGKMWDAPMDITDDQLRSIHVPTTVAAGQYDEVIKREHTEHIAASIPGSKLVIIPGVSHFGMLQDPAAFNKAVLDFLG